MLSPLFLLRNPALWNQFTLQFLKNLLTLLVRSFFLRKGWSGMEEEPGRSLLLYCGYWVLSRIFLAGEIPARSFKELGIISCSYGTIPPVLSLQCLQGWGREDIFREASCQWSVWKEAAEWFYCLPWTSLVAQMVKHLATMRETRVQSLGREDLEKEVATHSSILVWEIPWTEEPGGLQSMGSQRVGHWMTSLMCVWV